MDKIIWLIVMIPLSLLFSGLGVFAWLRKKPMWFWSGSTVDEDEIEDIPAYNRANGIMWLIYSLVFWASTILGIFEIDFAGIFLAMGCIGALPFLVIAYKKIYNKYKRK